MWNPLSLFRRRPRRPRLLPPGPKHEGKMVRAEGKGMASLAVSEFKHRPMTILPGSYAMRPMWPTFDSALAFSDGWKASSWVYVCTMKNAHALASMPWLVHRRVGRKLVPWPEHPLQRVLDRPNPWWSQRDLILRIALELQVAGNSVICKVRLEPTGKTMQLFTARPQLIAPVPSNDVHVAGFSVAALDGRRYFLGARDAIHVQLPDPTNPYWGYGIVAAGTRPINTDAKSADWQANAIDNALIPPGVFTINEAEGMDDDQWDKAIADLKEQYQGAVNARVPLVLSETKWQSLGMSPADMDWLKGRSATKKEIALLHGVPLGLLGEQSTFNNVHEDKLRHWEDGVLPLSHLMSDAMTIQLAQPEYGDEVVIAPDTRKVPALVNARNNQIDGVKTLWSMGTPFNHAAEYMGLDFEIPGGDIGYVPTNLIPQTTEGSIDAVDMIDTEAAPNQSAFKRKATRRISPRKTKTLVADFRRWLNTDVEDAEIVDEEDGE